MPYKRNLAKELFLSLKRFVSMVKKSRRLHRRHSIDDLFKKQAQRAMVRMLSSALPNIGSPPRTRSASGPSRSTATSANQRVVEMFQAATPASRTRTHDTTTHDGQLRSFAPNRAGTISNSKSAGFIQSRQKINAAKRRKVVSKGVYRTREYGGIMAPAGEMATIGHATNAYVFMVEAFTIALVKMIFNALKVSLVDVRRLMVSEYGFQSGDEIRLDVQTAPGETLSPLQVGISPTSTPLSCALGLQALLQNSSNANSELIFTRLWFSPNPAAGSVPAHDRIMINLIGARFHWDVKSSLKLQNRSTNVLTDNEAVDVNNCPLYGKSYMGKGTGSRYVTPYGSSNTMDTPPTIATTYGLIQKGSFATSADGISEPPLGEMFTDAKRTGKVLINPGDIKTSVLTHRSSCTLDELWRQLLISYNPTSAAYKYRRLGVFRFMCLEKMINASAGEAGIEIAYEMNIRYGGYVTTTMSKKTAEVFTKTYL